MSDSGAPHSGADSPMRIAIDARALTGPYTGDRTYWRSLIRALPAAAPETRFRLYSRLPIPVEDVPESPYVTVCCMPTASDRVWSAIVLPNAVYAEGADLLHVQYTAPPRPMLRTPVVTTVHDISFRLYPEWFPVRDRILMNLTVPLSMRAAARVITDSESSRSDILRTYALPPEKVVAIPLGVPDAFGASKLPPSEAVRAAARALAAEKYGIDGPFILAVGVLQPRKNLRVLAEAFGVARHEGGLPHRLVLVGKPGWHTERQTLRDLAARGGGTAAGEAILFPGYAADEDLPALYRACDVFAHPALYEGFGIPPIEAMACGAAVIVSDGPALPEVVGDAALITPARDVGKWARSLIRVLNDADLRARLELAGPRRAAGFRWETTAARTVEVYETARVKRNGSAQTRT